MEMSTWNFCTNSKLFPPLLPFNFPSTDSGRICSTFRMRRPFLAQLEFQTQLNFMFDMAIPGHAPPPSPSPSTPPLHFDPPPSPLCCESVQKFSLFCFGFAIRSGRRRKIFNAISIGFNSRKSQIWKLNWNLGKYPPRLRLMLAPHTVKGSRRHGMTQVQGRGSFGLEGICLCQIFAYKLIQKRARVLNRAQIALLNTHTHTHSIT